MAPLGGRVYYGKIDRTLRNRKTGKFSIWDYKVVAIDWARQINTKVHLQLEGYLWLNRESQECTTNDAGIDALLKDNTKGQGSMKRGECHRRLPVHRSNAQLDEWKVDREAEMAEMDRCESTGVWPKRDGYCHAFGGPCPYLRGPGGQFGLCEVSDPERVLDSGGYVERPAWEPWNL